MKNGRENRTQWQPRKRQRRKRSIKKVQYEVKRGREKRPLSFWSEDLPVRVILESKDPYPAPLRSASQEFTRRCMCTLKNSLRCPSCLQHPRDPSTAGVLRFANHSL